MMNKRSLVGTVLAGTLATGASAATSNRTAINRGPQSSPPKMDAPSNAKRVTITLRMTAKNGAAFAQHLLSVIPVTRIAAGCRYSHTFNDPNRPNSFLLIQGWDSIEQQQGYIAWRESTGDLKTFLEFLSGPPTIEAFQLLDA